MILNGFSEDKSWRITHPQIITQHIIPIFMAMLNESDQLDRGHLLRRIVNTLKVTLYLEATNWQRFIGCNLLTLLFSEYPSNPRYQCIQKELYQVLRVCIV